MAGVRPESAVAITVGGASVTPALLRGGLSWDWPLAGRATASLDVRYLDGSGARPAFRDEVIVAIDGSPVFGGIVLNRDRRPLVGKRGERWSLACGGWESYAQGVMVNGIIPSDSLKTMFSAIAGNLSSLGITVDPLMPTGPVCETLTLPFRSVAAAWDELSTQAGAPWRITPGKVAGAYAPGVLAAPFSLGVGGEPVAVRGAALEWSGAEYVNRLWIRFGESGEREVVENRTGNGTRTYPLAYATATGPAVVTVNGQDQAVGPGQPWTYAAGVLTQDSGEPLLGPGDVLVIPYVGLFPSVVMVQDDAAVIAHGEVSAVEDLPDVYDVAVARAWGEGRLAVRSALPAVARLTTWTPGLEPGMSIGVNLPALGMSGDWLITRIRGRHLLTTSRSPRRHTFAYQLELVEGAQWADGWERFFDVRRPANARGSGVSSVGTGAPPAPPPVVRGLTRATMPLGGSLFAGVRGTSWQRVSAFGAVVDWSALPSSASVVARVARKTASAGTSVTARIWNAEDAVAVSTGAPSTSTSATGAIESLAIPRAGGVRTYYLEIAGGNAGALIFGEGVLDVVVS